MTYNSFDYDEAVANVGVSYEDFRRIIHSIR